MFPEYRELMSELKSSDTHFLDLVQKHTALDEKIRKMAFHAEPGTPEEIETLKKEKLLVKDRVFALLKKADAARA